MKPARLVLLACLSTAMPAPAAEPAIIDFEAAVPLGADQKANRFPRWEEKGVVFTLAHEPKQSKGKGLLMFFTHLSTGHKGLVSAMATELIGIHALFGAFLVGAFGLVSSAGDVIATLVEDENTEVVAVYSEGIRDGARFVAALEAARKAKKPVVMMKVGRSEVGGAAARSHTASIAGDDAVVSAVLDALKPLGVRHLDMPMKSEKVWRAIQAAQQS